MNNDPEYVNMRLQHSLTLTTNTKTYSSIKFLKGTTELSALKYVLNQFLVNSF